MESSTLIGKKLGRPRKDDPKNIVIKCRLTNKEAESLVKFCKQTKETKSNVIRKALAAYYEHAVFNYDDVIKKEDGEM